MVILGGGVVEEALRIIEIVADVHIAQDAEERQGVVPVRNGATHRLRRCAGSQLRPECPARRRKPQCFAKIPSFHGRSLLIAPLVYRISGWDTIRKKKKADVVNTGSLCYDKAQSRC